jgi:BirA family biotin operon repressor/biotin-[acetyl-CoA-carboxylase] ligase
VQTTARPQTAFDLRRIEQESFVRQVEFHSVLPSTSDFALELAAQPDLVTPLLVLTEKQTAGRGRGSNRWWSRPGALTFSVVLDGPSEKGDRSNLPERPEGCSAQVGPVPFFARVSLTAALAVCQVLEQLVPHISYGIRWPNDVHCAGRKICGVLPELSRQRVEPPQSPRLVLGIGVNVNNSLSDAPPDVSGVGVSLLDLTDQSYDLTDFLVRLLRQLANGLDALARRDPQLADAVSQRCVLQGRVVELQAGPRHVRGLCQGIDYHGALTIRTTRGIERFFGGVISTVH